MRILHLTLYKAPFEVMVTGEKDKEFRHPSDRIISLLYNKDCSKKEFDLVEFTNGYGSKMPRFYAKYLYHDFMTESKTYTYSNGLTVYVASSDICIWLGEIVDYKP
jgi:hypothetical protein